MPRAGRSPVWWLWLVGLLAFLLTAPSGKVRSPQNVSPASGVVDVAAGGAGRVRIGIVVAAAALCVLLAVAVVTILQVNRMHEDREVAVALTGGDPTKAADLATRFGCAGCHIIPGLPGAHGQVGAQLADLRKKSIWRAWCATQLTTWCNGSLIRRRCRRAQPCRSLEFRDAKPRTWPLIFTPTDQGGRSGEQFGVGRAGNDLR